MAKPKSARRPARRLARSSARARGPRARGPAAARPSGRSAGRARAKPRAPKGRGRQAARATAPVAPNAIGLLEQHMDYTTHDLGAVERFYAQVLGFSESRRDPRFDYLHVRTSAASSLGFMAPMPGPPEQWRPPREPAIYLIVEDVDRAHRTLAERGVAFEQEPADMPWGHRPAVLRDPEGRLLCLAQPIAGPDEP